MSSVSSNGTDQTVRSVPSDPSVQSDGSVQSDRLRLAEAAVFLSVSVTTIKRYIAEGRLSYCQERGPTGHKLHLIPRADLIRLRDQEGTGPTGPTGPTGLIDPIRPLAWTGPTEPTEPSGRIDPLLLVAVERERDQALREVDHLRAQLDVRAEELRRRDQAEAELRRLLLTSQQVAHELAQQLDQRALPPHTEPAAPKKTRWWSLWRR